MKAAGLVLLSLLLLPVAGANHVDQFDILKVLEVGDIPAVYHPTFAREAYFDPGEEVIGLSLGSEARAYPIQVMNWHEVVNDVVGGTPVAITYCPLCGTGVVFSRIVGDQELTLGVSGRLYKSNLVMFDNETRTFWSQINGDAILGPLHGAKLAWVASRTLPWSDWEALHPDSLVLLPPLPQCAGGRTGSACRDYTVDPYRGYRSSTVVYDEFGGEYTDTLLHPKAGVLGIEVGGVAMAYPLFVLEEALVINDVLNGQRVVATFVNGSLQAFDRGGRTFAPEPGIDMVDGEGRIWNRLTGVSSFGEALPRIEAINAMWFIWAEFHPGTGVHSLRPPSVVTFELRPTHPTPTRGELLLQVVSFNNTSDAPLTTLRIRVELGVALDYVGDDASGVSSYRGRTQEDGVLSFAFAPVPPGPQSFLLTTRVRDADLPGIIFKSEVSIEYADADGRTITASRTGETFRVLERVAPPPSYLLLLALLPLPVVLWWVLKRRTPPG